MKVNFFGSVSSIALSMYQPAFPHVMSDIYFMVWSLSVEQTLTYLFPLHCHILAQTVSFFLLDVVHVSQS